MLLRRLEKVKAAWRVEFVCGYRAMRAARSDATLLDEAAANSVAAPLMFPPWLLARWKNASPAIAPVSA